MAPSRLQIDLLGLVPRKALTRTVGRAAKLHNAMAVRRFAAAYGLDMSEAERPLEDYPNIHELFTRRLKPGVRPVDPNPQALVSPVDGSLSERGPIGDGVLPQAKGRTYGLAALLAEPDAPSRYAEGSFGTIYLSPTDYHRMHSPVDGQLTEWTHVPGDLWPVNRASVAHVDALFAKNERLIFFIETETFGRVAMVMVGATIVGKVRASFDPELISHVPGRRDVHRGHLDREVKRGEELAVFEMGSTVILVTERPIQGWPEAGSAVRLGTALGTVS